MNKSTKSFNVLWLGFCKKALAAKRMRDDVSRVCHSTRVSKMD